MDGLNNDFISYKVMTNLEIDAFSLTIIFLQILKKKDCLLPRISFL